MPRKFSLPPIPSGNVLLTSHGLAQLAGCHHSRPAFALGRGVITAAAWLDLRGRVVPLFTPADAVRLAQSMTPPPVDLPPRIS